jgi:hypothetical protein
MKDTQPQQMLLNLNDANAESASQEKDKKSATPRDEIVLSDDEFAALSEFTNAEQMAKLRCWDIQEYVDNITPQILQLEQAVKEANEQLEEAKKVLSESRTGLKAKFDEIFGPLGLQNKMISISQNSPHVVTLVDTQEANSQEANS